MLRYFNGDISLTMCGGNNGNKKHNDNRCVFRENASG